MTICFPRFGKSFIIFLNMFPVFHMYLFSIFYAYDSWVWSFDGVPEDYILFMYSYLLLFEGSHSSNLLQTLILCLLLDPVYGQSFLLSFPFDLLSFSLPEIQADFNQHSYIFTEFLFWSLTSFSCSFVISLNPLKCLLVLSLILLIIVIIILLNSLSWI
jgi:hypothetical protein